MAGLLRRSKIERQKIEIRATGGARRKSPSRPSTVGAAGAHATAETDFNGPVCRFLRAFSLAWLVLLLGSAPLAAETLMEIAGVPGESTRPGREDWFAIESFTVEPGSSISEKPGLLAITRSSGKASAALYRKYTQGEHIGRATLEQCRDESCVTIVLTDVMITSIVASSPFEQVSFEFRQLEQSTP